MIIKSKIMKQLYDDAGLKRVEKAKEYVNLNKVKIVHKKYTDPENFEIYADVEGTKKYYTTIKVVNNEIEDVTCECPDYYEHYGACKHIIATMLQFEKEDDEKNQKAIQNTKIKLDKIKYKSFSQIVNMFYNEEVENLHREEEEIKTVKEPIKIQPKLLFDKYTNNIKIEFKIGNKRMYKIKDLSEFYDNVVNEKEFKYGVQLEFVHKQENFRQEDIKLLNFIIKHAEIIKNVNSDSSSNYNYYGIALNVSYITLNNSTLDEIFDVLEGQEVDIDFSGTDGKVRIIAQNPDMQFQLEKSSDTEYKLKPSRDIKNVYILNGKENKYILTKNELCRCDENYEKGTLKLIDIFKKNFLQEVYINETQLPELFSIIMPKIKSAIKFVKIKEEEIEKFKPQQLQTKIYLDFDENNFITANVKFSYGEETFNPLDEENDKKIKCARNIIEETKIMNSFRKSGFMYYQSKKMLILPEEDKIYSFLTKDIEEYMNKYEVLVTDNFKSKEIKQPKIGNIGVKVENNLLTIDLSSINIDPEELKEIMEKYNLKKKYHKLKNGQFVELEDNKELEFIDKLVTGMDLNYNDLEKGTIRLPVQRTLYLNQLLKTIENTEITKNAEYKEIVNGLDRDKIEEEISIPECLEKVLRYYQKTGYRWLKVLDQYKFGGILADDMGLGKTVQMLSIIAAYVEEKDNRRASIVVCPSSLTLNWQNEAKKFTNEIQAMVIRGDNATRKEQISQIDNYDLVITSYDLLKRDIDLYKEAKYQFRYIIADEAQYLKNSNTQNAKAVKTIQADTRYALTGTPIENSLSELWSIFDFIMPGYLFTYKKFKEHFETPIVKDNDIRAMQKLKMLIEPFVLRRTKKQVLTELPEKTITVLNNQMKEEQEKIYLTYLSQIKADILSTVNDRGFEKSQIQILAALTRLRQICCHPGIFIDDYKDGSSKLDQCMEIVKEAANSGHKILIFSVYTSMFEILEKELKANEIKYFKLTGQTKVDERIELVDEFNTNEDIKVFLISLKAGGTGLNLTGADMVIHYDPWWNSSAENQATDRAYRIGQKRNVQVYKLITKNSIEEKIYELQQKKSELIDSMLDTNTSFINKLSKEEIMNLFT